LAARADEPGARAVTAVDRAEIRHEQQDPVRVAVHEPRDRARTVLAERVVLLARRGFELAERRHDCAAQRLARVVRIDEAHVVRGNTGRQRPLVAANRFALVVRQPEHALELLEAANSIAVLPTPVVPLRALDGRKEALAKRIARRADHMPRARHGDESRRGVRSVFGKRSGFRDGGFTFGKRRTWRLFLQRRQLVHLRPCPGPGGPLGAVYRGTAVFVTSVWQTTCLRKRR